nr:TPA_asm: m09.5 sORF [Murid betaherpesvirus 1]DBA07921.1 TPA_asm: m09.5 sORF [Murid betaherpesvirus 1]
MRIHREPLWRWFRRRVDY